MSQFQSEFNAPPMAPPQHGGEIPAQPSSWPTVIGVLLIVLACIGLLSNTCGGIASFVMPALMGSIADQAKGDPMVQVQVDITNRFMLFNLANAGILIVLGVILLIGAIKVLRRRRSGVGMTKLWAISRIVWSLPAAYATYVITTESMKAMQQASADSGQPIPAGFTTFLQALGPISAVINLFLWCAVPVFVLIWFMRARIKSEIETWS